LREKMLFGAAIFFESLFFGLSDRFDVVSIESTSFGGGCSVVVVWFTLSGRVW
jgi:hypothetical protein